MCGMIRANFNNEEAEMICKIRINRKGTEDKLIWNFSKDDKFTVRSAYYVAKNIGRRKVGESLRFEQADERWKKNWKLNVLGATKHFLWRAGTNSLPKKASLFSRKIGKSVNCPIYKLGSETIMLLYGNVHL